jgi:hypothetical protein
MSRQLALGGQPVLVARWAEAVSVVEQHAHLNRLLLVDARNDEPALAPLVRAAAARGCALVVCLGVRAEDVQRTVDSVCEAAALSERMVATSWHDPSGDPDAALDAFSLFTTWVGGRPGIPLLVTEDSGLDTILEAARRLHGQKAPKTD